MKKIALLAMTVAAICSCDFSNVLNRIVTGDGNSVEVPYELGAFAAISSVGFVDVFYAPTSGPQSVVLTCDENLAEYYIVEIRDGALYISTKPGYMVRHKAKTFVTVSSAPVYGLSSTGSGDCVINGEFAVDGDFKLISTGSGDMRANGVVSCKDFEAKTSGSGDIELGGIISQSAKFSSLGSGDLEVDTITSDSISMSFAGSGDGSFGCKDAGDIDVRISGSGSVTLTGNARTLQSKVSGSGKVNSYYLALSGGR